MFAPFASYAGRNQIPLVTAAGRGTETDGGQARNPGRSESYTLRFGSVRNNHDSRQTFSAIRDFNSSEGRRTCNSGKTGNATCSGS
jgi:hypothetical protein